MRALVTGATGFIGSYLTARLLDAGAAVAVLTLVEAADTVAAGAGNQPNRSI